MGFRMLLEGEPVEVMEVMGEPFMLAPKGSNELVLALPSVKTGMILEFAIRNDYGDYEEFQAQLQLDASVNAKPVVKNTQ
jgi:hypothetical protein